METHWKAVVMTALMFLLVYVFVPKAEATTIYSPSLMESRDPGILEKSNDLIHIMNKITKYCDHVDKRTAFKIATSVHKYSKKYNIPAGFILTIIYTESRFKPNAMGQSNDTGLMQIIPRYHKDRLDRFGITQKELLKIDLNIKVGCDILNDIRGDRSNSFTVLWLMAKGYNGSSSYANKVMYRYKKLFRS